jgi:hypothetical protein
VLLCLGCWGLVLIRFLQAFCSVFALGWTSQVVLVLVEIDAVWLVEIFEFGNKISTVFFNNPFYNSTFL